MLRMQGAWRGVGDRARKPSVRPRVAVFVVVICDSGSDAKSDGRMPTGCPAARTIRADLIVMCDRGGGSGRRRRPAQRMTTACAGGRAVWSTGRWPSGWPTCGDSGNGGGSYYPHCRLFGGCMEHRIPQPRTSFVGTAYVLQLEKLAAEACYDREAFGMFPGGTAPGEGVQAIDVIEHQYMVTFGQKPTNKDLELSIAYFDSHLSDPEFGDVSALESAGRGHCRALLTTNRFLFY